MFTGERCLPCRIHHTPQPASLFGDSCNMDYRYAVPHIN